MTRSILHVNIDIKTKGEVNCMLVGKEKIMKKLNKILKTKRLDAQLTQAELAEKAGISLRGYQYIENEGAMPSGITLIMLAKVLNTTAEELFGN